MFKHYEISIRKNYPGQTTQNAILKLCFDHLYLPKMVCYCIRENFPRPHDGGCFMCKENLKRMRRRAQPSMTMLNDIWYVKYCLQIVANFFSLRFRELCFTK